MRHQRHEGGAERVLNLSVLDGWFDEAYELSGGWAIGDREEYHDWMESLHATAVYSLIENEILPLYYADREDAFRCSGFSG